MPVGEPTSTSEESPLEAAITAFRRDLVDIRTTMPRCGSCECFLAVAAQASMDLRRIDSAVAGEARDLFRGWLDEAEGRVQVCNNCEICVPTGPYERFTAALASWRAGREEQP